MKRRTESTHIWLGKSTNGNISYTQQDRQFLHKNNAPFLSTSRSIIDIPQDPEFIGKRSNNPESLSELHAEEKKQDDDIIDLGASSSVTPTIDNRSSMLFCDAGLAPPDVHVTESDVSSWEGNRRVDFLNDEPSHESKEILSEINAMPSFDRIILSLNDEYYKEIMWRYYRMLGKTRDSDREARIGNEIFSTFKQSLGLSGRFFKRAQDQDFEVNDETALASKFDLVIPIHSHVMMGDCYFPHCLFTDLNHFINYYLRNNC